MFYLFTLLMVWYIVPELPIASNAVLVALTTGAVAVVAAASAAAELGMC